MRYPGTISLREETFRSLLDDIASSLKAHGFQHILLIGDNGGNQTPMSQVASELNAAWGAGRYTPRWLRKASSPIANARSRTRLVSAESSRARLNCHSGNSSGHPRPARTPPSAEIWSRVKSSSTHCGCGRAIAVRLAKDYDILALARTAPALEELAREIEAMGSKCTVAAVDEGDHGRHLDQSAAPDRRHDARRHHRSSRSRAPVVIAWATSAETAPYCSSSRKASQTDATPAKTKRTPSTLVISEWAPSRGSDPAAP